MNIPKGLKLVPEVATLEMKNAGWRECDRQGIEPESIEMQTIWTAMHLEAPTPPQPIYDEAKERELFEAFWKSNMNVEVMDLHRNIYPMNSGWSYACHETNRSWMTWVACAQSRAKAGEDE